MAHIPQGNIIEEGIAGEDIQPGITLYRYELKHDEDGVLLEPPVYYRMQPGQMVDTGMQMCIAVSGAKKGEPITVTISGIISVVLNEYPDPVDYTKPLFDTPIGYALNDADKGGTVYIRINPHE